MTSPSTYKLGYPPLKYSVVPFAGAYTTNPTSSDVLSPTVGGPWPIGTIRVNKATGGAWILTNVSGPTATWTGITDAATGDVVGPASATDNAIPRFDGTTGKLIQNSLAVLSDAGVLTGLTQVGIGITPTAILGLKAGTATAGTAPLKFALGVNLTSPEAGAVEYDGTHLTYTNSVPTRKTIAQGPASSTDLALAKYTGTGGEIQNSGTTLSAADVMTFPANGGTVYTAGTRKGASSFGAGGISAPIATAAVAANSVIVITRLTLSGAAAALGNYVTITPGVSFIVTSGDAADTSTFEWAIVA